MLMYSVKLFFILATFATTLLPIYDLFTCKCFAHSGGREHILDIMIFYILSMLHNLSKSSRQIPLHVRCPVLY